MAKPRAGRADRHLLWEQDKAGATPALSTPKLRGYRSWLYEVTRKARLHRESAYRLCLETCYDCLPSKLCMKVGWGYGENPWHHIPLNLDGRPTPEDETYLVLWLKGNEPSDLAGKLGMILIHGLKCVVSLPVGFNGFQPKQGSQ